MFVLFVDPYFLGDPLFATGLARDLRARMDAGGGGFVIVHGTGEEGERAIEAMGEEPVREAGALQLPSVEAGRAVDRAGRDLNRQVVDALNEAGVSAVRVVGSDRGLARPDGALGKTAWLSALAQRRAVPVVLALTADEVGTPVDLDSATLSARLGEAMGGAPVVALATRALPSQHAAMDEVRRAAPDAEALRRMELAGSSPILVQRSALRQAGIPTGTPREGGAA